MSQALTQIKIRKWALRKAGVNADKKGFCDISGRTFLQLLFRAEALNILNEERVKSRRVEKATIADAALKQNTTKTRL